MSADVGTQWTCRPNMIDNVNNVTKHVIITSYSDKCYKRIERFFAADALLASVHCMLFIMFANYTCTSKINRSVCNAEDNLRLHAYIRWSNAKLYDVALWCHVIDSHHACTHLHVVSPWVMTSKTWFSTEANNRNVLHPSLSAFSFSFPTSLYPSPGRLGGVWECRELPSEAWGRNLLRTIFSCAEIPL